MSFILILFLNMKDVHIHFHKQPYSLEVVTKMITTGVTRGVDEFYLLDHTHKFQEFSFLYQLKTDEFSYNHYKDKKYIPIKEYLDFIDEVRKSDLEKRYNVKLYFGLEVCYFKEFEDKLKEELNKYNFDFLIGSVHHINGFAFDLKRDTWIGRSVDELYTNYYKIMKDLIRSKMFTHLAHPDSIKIFDYYPTFSLTNEYKDIAKLLKEYNMTTENNSGFDRYGLTNIGLNDEFYDILKANGVTIYKASDAHEASYVGNKFNELR